MLQYDLGMVTVATPFSHQWKPNDLLRMETKILELVEWNVGRCTYLDFLSPLRKVLNTQMSESELSLIYSKAEKCLLSSECLNLKVCLMKLPIVISPSDEYIPFHLFNLQTAISSCSSVFLLSQLEL